MTETAVRVPSVAGAPSPTQASEAQLRPLTPGWSVGRRFLFRFVCCYWLLYALPPSAGTVLLGLARTVPGRAFLASYYGAWRAFTAWAGVHVLGLDPSTVQFRGGEGAHAWVQNLLFVVLALLAAGVWSLLDRRREQYHVLNGWLRLVVRYMLALPLLQYGFDKVFPLQFQEPFHYSYLTSLMQPFGELSRTQVLWNFMAVSIPYTMFTGVIEVGAGLFLLFRRTTYIGAALALVATSHVAILNYTYDVGLQLFTTNLVLMAVFLLAPAVGPVVSLLVRQRAVTPPRALDGPVIHRPMGRVVTAVTCALVVIQSQVQHLVTGWSTGRGSQVPSLWQQYKAVYVTPVRSPLYGLYRVESGGPAGWTKVAIQFPDQMAVRTAEDWVAWFPTEYDTAQRTLMVDRKAGLGSFVWSRPDSTRLLLAGTFRGAPLTVSLRRIDKDLPLAKYSPLPAP